MWKDADGTASLGYPIGMLFLRPADTIAIAVRLCRVLTRLGILAFSLSPGFLSADSPTAKQSQAELDFFESKIRPVLIEHCYSCHSAEAEEVEGGLLLDTRAGIRRGGESGPTVVPSKPTESLLVSAIRYESFEMPPEQKLPPNVVKDFEQWIAHGAIDPRDGDAVTRDAGIDLEEGRKFWAFQPPRAQSPPAVSDQSWPQTEIDRFVLAKLESQGMQPASDADRQTLLRRIYYALIGLPPTPQELDDFVTDGATTTEAVARAVDRLLASELFGERWGRHWLDVVRYADSSGGGRSTLFPHAWRYRDYVIDAFNDDLPFDEFVREQLAGDLMESTDWQQRRRRLTATAFLVLGPTNFELQDKDVLEMDIADEQVDTLGKAFMGMTLGCARCHDHKFDPIPTRDYYAMAGIFKSTVTVQHDNVSACNTAKLPLSPDDEAATEQFDAEMAKLLDQRSELEAKLKHAKSKSSKDDPPTQSLAQDLYRKQMKSLQGKIKTLKAGKPNAPIAMAVADKDEPDDIPLAIRGVVHNQGAIVPRGVLQVCDTAEFPDILSDASGRMELAQWLTSPSHPLTARVAVNRVWHWLMGQGLVRTVDNFGSTGERPSHPELLDYLAHRFVEEGWSVKQLIREIMLSRTYRMSTARDASAIETDPDNRWLSHMNRQRLDAESIRDTLLLIAGELDSSAGGPAIAKGTKIEYGYVFKSKRRTVYLPIFRNRLPQLMEVFDFADPNIQLGSRNSSTTVPQAHFLMNNPFMLEVSDAAANRLLARSELDETQRLRFAFHQVLGRGPSEVELQLAESLLEEGSDQSTNWSMLYQTLFQSIDFRYLN